VLSINIIEKKIFKKKSVLPNNYLKLLKIIIKSEALSHFMSEIIFRSAEWQMRIGKGQLSFIAIEKQFFPFAFACQNFDDNLQKIELAQKNLLSGPFPRSNSQESDAKLYI